LNFLFLDLNGHRDVEAQGLVGGYDHVIVFVNRESLGYNSERILACGQSFEFIESLSVALHGDGRRGNGGGGHDDVGVGNGGAGRVGYLAAKNARGGQRRRSLSRVEVCAQLHGQKHECETKVLPNIHSVIPFLQRVFDMNSVQRAVAAEHLFMAHRCRPRVRSCSRV